MKRYLVLAGEDYYPSGWDDWIGSYDTLDKAIACGTARVGSGYISWYSVFDLENEEVVASG